jgi:hypothetical protein
MRICEERNYTMYLSVSEFELLYNICKEVGFGYTFRGDQSDEDGEYKIILTEEMLDEISDLLERRYSYELYEECNRFAADEIKYLLNDIYYELPYNM